jgi:hypothetical protein
LFCVSVVVPEYWGKSEKNLCVVKISHSNKLIIILWLSFENGGFSPILKFPRNILVLLLDYFIFSISDFSNNKFLSDLQNVILTLIIRGCKLHISSQSLSQSNDSH